MWSPEGVAGYSGWLLETLRRQQEDGRLCDVTLQVEDATVCLHRCLLAANSAMLASVLTSLQDGQSNLYLSDVAKEGFLPLVGYMYTGRLDLTNVQPQTVLSVAQMLQMNEAEALCRQCIQNHDQKERVYPITKKTMHQDQASQTTVDVNFMINKALSYIDQSSQTEDDKDLILTSKDAANMKTVMLLKKVSKPNKSQSSSGENVRRNSSKKKAPKVKQQQMKLSAKSSEKENIADQQSASQSKDEEEVVAIAPGAEKLPFQCTDCDKSFSRRTQLRLHASTHTDKPFKCQVCGQAFSQRYFLERHTDSSHRKILTKEQKEVTATNQTRPKLQKGAINGTFNVKIQSKDKKQNDETKTTESGLSQSEGMVEESGRSPSVIKIPRVYQCPVCFKSFRTQREMRDHKSTHYLSQDFPSVRSKQLFSPAHEKCRFRCKVCTLAFKKKKALIIHVKKYHTGQTSRKSALFKCKQCKRKFLHKQNMQRHLASCQRLDDVPQPRRDDADAHQNSGNDHSYNLSTAATRIHREPKKVLKTVNGRQKHNELQHGKPNRNKKLSLFSHSKHTYASKQKMRCGACISIFSRLLRYKAHPTDTHNIKKTADTPVFCEYCQRKFSLKSLLFSHSCKSTEPCQRCYKKFLSYGQCRRHKLNHYHSDCLEEETKKKAATRNGKAVENLKSALQHPCPICDEMFSTKRKCLTHMEIHRVTVPDMFGNMKNLFECKICKKMIKHAAYLIKHMKYHVAGRPFSCEMCGKGFVSRPNLQHHIAYVHEKVRDRYVCEVCGAVYVSKVSLTDHMLLHNSDKLHQCPLCQIDFRTRLTLDRHMRNAHSRTSLNQPVSCPVCQETFVNQSTLRRHKEQMHPERTSEIYACACDTCGKVFPTQMKLRRHMQYHQRNSTKLNCDLCDATFMSDYGLKMHKRKHEGDKRFVCEICNRRFYLSSSLIEHRKTHTNDRNIVCHVCGETFRFKSGLRAHSRKHMQKEHVCHVCDKAFHYLLDLQKHIETHSSARPHPCPVCDKSFKTRNHLVRHFHKTHPESEHFQCLLCSYCGLNQAELDKHRDRKHDFTVQTVDVSQIVQTLELQCEDDSQLVEGSELVQQMSGIKEESYVLVQYEDLYTVTN